MVIYYKTKNTIRASKIYFINIEIKIKVYEYKNKKYKKAFMSIYY